MFSQINYDLHTNYRFLNNPKDKVVGVVLKTTNYDQFHIDNLNRNLNMAHAKSLLKALKKNKSLVLEPILVDKSMKIVDGQHRFWALSKLGLPITYIIDNQISIIDAPKLNCNQRNWSAIDFIKVFANKGNINYQRLLDEVNEYKTVSTTNMISLTFSTNRSGKLGGRVNKEIATGKYKFDEQNKRKNEEFFDLISALHSKLGSNHRITANIQEAIKMWYFNPAVDRDRLNKVIDREFIESAPMNTSMCAKSIGERYNSRLRNQNKVDYYISANGNFSFFAK